MRSEKEIIENMAKAREIAWINPRYMPYREVRGKLPLSAQEIDDAAARLRRFEPFIMKCFPETIPQHGMIESPLTNIENTKRKLVEEGLRIPEGALYIKRDSDLAIAGSVKARGGVYEVLKHAETIALQEHLITLFSDYSELTNYRDVFQKYGIQVGSTGNLGMSIGIMSAAIGFDVTVHMSADAKQWKKDKLRASGVRVMEYESDYGHAVAEGRKAAEADPMCHFVDDERSVDLFLGYAVAAERLEWQLYEQGIKVDEEHPLFVYLPCGVGGAPGGITFGLKEAFGDAVHCFFAEPVQCPCMTLGLASGKQESICVGDIGLSGKTAADGLAVSRPSALASGMMDSLLSGAVTVRDEILFRYMNMLEQKDGIFIEPSSCAAFAGYVGMAIYEDMEEYLHMHGLKDKMKQSTHILWATGGSMVPESVRKIYRDEAHTSILSRNP